MENDFSEAVRKDLGREGFVTWFAELCILKSEVVHTMKMLHKWAADECVDTPTLIGPAKSRIVYEPLGVVLIIGSWNFPLYTTLGPLIHAIAAGNCAIIKPSEISAHSSNMMKRFIMRQLDMQCFVVIEGQVEVAKSLTSKKFDMICFTGSTDKGKLVAQSAAKNLVPCLLELGGKSPSVVDETADIEFACKKISFGRYFNSGQICIAPDYTFVHASKIDKFMETMKRTIME